MPRYNRPFLVLLSATRTMEALFSSGVTALKLEYLISHANTFGAKCIGKSCGFKTWEKIHCGCYISSPGYVMTTEEKKMNCALQLPLLGFDCCHTTNNDRSLHFSHTFFLFLLRFSPVTEKRDVHFVTLWDTSLGYCTEPCAHEQSILSQLRRGWINCHTDHSL